MEHHSNLIPWQQACRAAGATPRCTCTPTRTASITPAEMDAKIGPTHQDLSAAAQVSNVLGVREPRRAAMGRARARARRLPGGRRRAVARRTCRVDVRASSAPTSSPSRRTQAVRPFRHGRAVGLATSLLNAMPPFLTGGEMIDSVTEHGRHLGARAREVRGRHAGRRRHRTPPRQRIGYVEGSRLGLDVASPRASRRSCATAMDADGEAAVRRPSSAARPRACTTASSASTSTASTRTTWPASWTWTRSAIRAGHHCAQPLLTWLGVENLACCRASLAFYNDKKDVDALIEGLGNVWRTFNG